MRRQALIVLLVGLLPIVAAHASYLLNVLAGAGLEPQYLCWPYLDGCVSISRAARSGPGLLLFKALMLPCALLLWLGWRHIGDWLRALAACGQRRRAVIGAVGRVGAVFLAVYVTWLGTEGDWYRWLRRYGVVFYFGGTALAQLLLVWVLWPQRGELAAGRHRKPIAWLTALVSLQWALGVFSAFKRLIFSDPDFIDRLEFLTEWWFALAMSLAFFVLARMLMEPPTSADEPNGGCGRRAR